MRASTDRWGRPLGLLCLVPLLFTALSATTARADSTRTLDCSPGADSAHTVWAAADFDGNKTIDLARLTVRLGRDGVTVSALDLFAFCPDSAPPAVNVFPRLGLVLIARDIDRDQDQDLVLREPFAGQAVGVWLNDGTGSFSKADPSDYPGVEHDPPCIGKRGSRVREQTASSTSNAYVPPPRCTGEAAPIPESSRIGSGNPRLAASGGPGARQSRAPPALSR
jgi:hypothetical protein